MRPRVFPAEDRNGQRGRTIERPGFNEAAGIPRGRLALQHARARIDARFNEAAGIPRGRQLRNRPRLTLADRFNEAAGIPRGRRARVG